MRSMLNFASKSIFSLSLALLLLAGVAGLARADALTDPLQTDYFSISCTIYGCGGQACGSAGVDACVFKTYTLLVWPWTWTDCGCY